MKVGNWLYQYDYTGECRIDPLQSGPVVPWSNSPDKTPQVQQFSQHGAQSIESAGTVRVTVIWAGPKGVECPPALNLRVEAMSVVVGPGTYTGSNGYGDPWTTSSSGGSAFGKHLIRADLSRERVTLTFPQSVMMQNSGFASSHTVFTDLRVYEDPRQANIARLDGIMQPRVGDVIEADTLYSWPGIPGLNGLDNVTPVVGSATGGWSEFPLGGNGMDVHVDWIGRGINASYSPILPPPTWMASAAQPMFADGPSNDWRLKVVDAQDGAQAEVTLRWKLHYRYENFRRNTIEAVREKLEPMIASQYMAGPFDGPIVVHNMQAKAITERSYWKIDGVILFVDPREHLDAEVRAEIGQVRDVTNSSYFGHSTSFGFNPSIGPGVYRVFEGFYRHFHAGLVDEWFKDGNFVLNRQGLFYDASKTVWTQWCEVIRD